jgi:hypothetical protein
MAWLTDKARHQPGTDLYKSQIHSDYF